MCWLKTGACLIQVHFTVFSFFGGKSVNAVLIQEVATKTVFTVLYETHINTILD